LKVIAEPCPSPSSKTSPTARRDSDSASPRPILALLYEAIRRDVHFIDRHPTTLFSV
jgi:hypothetical protein